MCRALMVVCCALDERSLQALKRAVVSANWEVAGTTSEDEALDRVEDRKAHILVAWGDFQVLVRKARDRFPGLRIVLVGPEPVEEADATIDSIEDVKGAILGSPPVGGPVRS